MRHLRTGIAGTAAATRWRRLGDGEEARRPCPAEGGQGPSSGHFRVRRWPAPRAKRRAAGSRAALPRHAGHIRR